MQKPTNKSVVFVYMPTGELKTIFVLFVLLAGAAVAVVAACFLYVYICFFSFVFLFCYEHRSSNSFASLIPFRRVHRVKCRRTAIFHICAHNTNTSTHTPSSNNTTISTVLHGSHWYTYVCAFSALTTFNQSGVFPTSSKISVFTWLKIVLIILSSICLNILFYWSSFRRELFCLPLLYLNIASIC